MVAIRFLYIQTLKRPDTNDDLPLRKVVKRLPIVLSPAEVANLLANYTWSKALTNTQQRGANTPLNQMG